MKIGNIKVGGRNCRVFVADGFFSRALGLSWRRKLDCDGMLFVFPFKRRWPVWMLGMRFDLDILFLGDNGEIVDVKRGIARPRKFVEHFRTFKPKVAAKYVLELRAINTAKLN